MKLSERAHEKIAGALVVGMGIAALILGLFLLLTLNGCAVKKADPLPAAEAVQIPVIVEKFEAAVTDEAPKVEAIITVPPSDKPTVVKIKKRELSLYRRALTNTPKLEFESNNPEATASQPKRNLWGRWAVAIAAGLTFAVFFIGWVWRRVRDWEPLKKNRKS